jgi:hypothetical protein
MYFNSIRLSVCSTISAIVATSIIVPGFRHFAIIVCLLYVIVWCFSTFKMYSEYEIDQNFGKNAIKYALIDNGKEIVFFLIALLVAVMVTR